MRKALQEFFDVPRSVRNGIVVLFIFITVIFAIRWTISYFSPEPNYDFSEIDAQLDKIQSTSKPDTKNDSPVSVELFSFNPNKASKEDFLRLGLSPKIAYTIINYRNKVSPFYKKTDLLKIYGLQKADYERLQAYIVLEKQSSPNKPKKEVSKVPSISNIAPSKPNPPVYNLSPFDPNIVSREQLTQMGFSDKIANTVLKFRARGSFRKTSDFEKIYGISKSDFKKIEPFIKIAPAKKQKVASSKTPKVLPKFAKKSNKPISVNINQASEEELQKVRGIGPTFAKRIVKFRKALGGFYSIDQVGDTYGIPDTSFQKIRPYLNVKKPPTIKKININTLTVDELKYHAYFDWKKANILVNYRKQHGDFKSIEDVKKILAYKADFIKKVEPYLVY